MSNLSNLIERFRKLHTALVSDALIKFGIRAQMDWDIKPVIPDINIKICGPAWTLKHSPAKSTAPPKMLFEALEAAKSGDVIVQGTGGLKNAPLWGELFSRRSMQKGIEGVVLDSGTRDVRDIINMKFPVFARSVIPCGYVGLLDLTAYNVSIQCGSVSVDPGDIILGDFDGVAVIPKGIAEEVLETSEELAAKEEGILEELNKGKIDLIDIYKRYYAGLKKE